MNKEEWEIQYHQDCKLHLRKFIIDSLSDEWLNDITLEDFNFFVDKVYLNHAKEITLFQIENIYKSFVIGLRRGRIQTKEDEK